MADAVAKEHERARAVQHRIRESALQQSSFLQDMAQWEKDIRKRDRGMKKSSAADPALPPVRGGNVVAVESKTAAKHTHDQGYGRWEQFNVEEALRGVDVPSAAAAEEAQEPPATRRTAAPPRDPEAAQRELGNAAFARGDYAAAVKSYTVCLGLKKDNLVAFSNRAMAYLKLKEYHNAHDDCCRALALDPRHLKSLQRRATARDALGKHRAALLDIHAALALQPSNKALLQHRLTVRRHLRACADAAPFHNIPIPSSS